MTNDTRACTKCAQVKPREAFHPDASRPDGLRSHCKACRAAGRQEARKGWSPDHDMKKTVPDGFHVRGISTLYNADGEISAQWVKSAIDKDHALQALMDAVQTLADPFKGLANPVTLPADLDDDLLAVYPLGDPHFGMYAWADEAGEHFDLEIAERDLVTAIDDLVRHAPAAKQALIVSLGDIGHSDGNNATTTAGTRVDVDTRWSKVFAVMVRAMRRCITRALEKHERVRVICATGNHDEMTSAVLAICLAQYYERESRVEVDTSPAKFYWYRFGKCLLGVHHGDKTKAADLPGVMACDRTKDWGETEHRKWYCGHVHHESVKEYPGVKVETYRTLAPKDAWHAGQGYRSGRDLRLEVWHREDGEIDRRIIGIRKIRRLQDEAKRTS